MKLIDRKGRLFGLINIVDLLIIILIIGFVAVFSVRLTSQKFNANGGTPLSSKEDIYVTLYSSLVVPEIAENLQIGDKLIANNAYTNAEIVSISVEPAAYVSTNSDGEAVLSEHPLWKDVTVVIKDSINPNNIVLKAANQEVRIGYTFILKTQTVETNCKIRGVEFGSTFDINSLNTYQPETSTNLDINFEEEIDEIDETEISLDTSIEENYEEYVSTTSTPNETTYTSENQNTYSQNPGSTANYEQVSSNPTSRI